jgi:hypothetical protein
VNADRYTRYCSACGCAYTLVSWDYWSNNKYTVTTDRRPDRCAPCRLLRRAQQRRDRAAAARPAHICDRCGDVFTPRRSDAKFCSGACRVAAHRAG